MINRETKELIAERHRKALLYWKETLHLSVDSWCKKAGISEGTLRNFLNGKSATIEAYTLELLAAAIDKTISELLLGEKTMKDVINQSDIALTNTMQCLIALLLKKNYIKADELDSMLKLTDDLYRVHHYPHAKQVMDELHKFLTGAPHPLEQVLAHTLVKLAPAGSA